ncbi:GNAT family N-acetyltransferase [Haloplasma contractile]|uniref:N-acetyltransferase domain-containing protein n=1 Tax=Haloplasma contractile SSD-17B TaxID=1033810 RepID=F7PVU5_9MOLU|nr:GNAT family N-acetyltransferase [Haloplasma contractile]ERJ12734.1 hypothetical protein HLPCO_001074 [Haloplasma contractile SSD-17B]
MNKIEFKRIHTDYVNQALELVLSAFVKEKQSVPFLPKQQEFYSFIEEAISNLFAIGNGLMAIENDELVGFIVGFEIKEFFGKTKGIYVPLFGHGLKNSYDQLYTELYKRVAELWVKDDFMMHAINIFAHDKKTINEWFWMGFGMRCVDSIKEISLSDKNDYLTDIIIKKVTEKDLPILGELHKSHNEYYRSSPIFMPTVDEDPIMDLTEWCQKKDHHLWAAFHEGKPLGYMRIQPDGESVISRSKTMMNITGGFVTATERSKGIGQLLLKEIENWLYHNNYPLLGVDFESINITGSQFWNKHFTKYTYSLVRRIDERIKY